MVINSPFDLIKILFEKREVWDTISKSEKSKHWFMVNRTLSIGYPKQAHYLNLNGVSTHRAIDVWFHFVVKHNINRCPGWIYTKSSAAAKEDKKWWPSSSVINFYCDKYNCCIRDLKEWQTAFPEDFEDTLKPFEKILK